MKEAPNIAELAVAAWRLERWLDNLNAERKMAAKKSLREIKKYLEASEIEIVDPLGWRFDPGLAVEVVNNEAEDIDEDELIIVQTNSPIIKQSGAVIQYGKIILGQTVKEQKVNNEIKSDSISNGVSEVSNPQTDEEAKNVLKQSDLFVDPDDTYWFKKFDCKAVRTDEQVVIIINSNVATELLLMDEKVYKDYCNGIPPMNPFWYKPKAGSCYITLPYPDIWVLVAYPSGGRKCSGYYFDMNCQWMQKDEVPRAFEASKKKSTLQNESEGEEVDTSNDASVGQEAVGGTVEHSTHISVESEDISAPPKEEGGKKVPDLTDEELEKLRKKNLSSFYSRTAIDRGLFQPHGKKKR